MKISPLVQSDYYKQSHYRMYPVGTTKIYSNFCPRKSRINGVEHVVFFGLQYYIKEYLIKQWNENFFNRPKDEVISEFTRLMDNTLGKGAIDTKHIEDLYDLGYLPLEIKALPEGSVCNIRVPVLTITNTVDHAYWLVNFLETIISDTLWQPITSATIAFEYRKLLNKYAQETVGDTSFVDWQGHDFSMRGMSSLESACTSGAAHLLSFTGTDTIPAISFLEEYYNADVTKELVGASVPATEHSVACLHGKDNEIGQFEYLMDLYPEGILSVVSDTWDLWKVCTEYVTTLKDKILARNGKLVIRPDSGDPVDIICGLDNKDGYHIVCDEVNLRLRDNQTGISKPVSDVEYKGVIELLWDVFGGTINEQGYKVLDPHIGAIYGDSITLQRAEEICERLKAKGFASTNIVLGIGSYTYQYNTRDTFGFAMKATYGEITKYIAREDMGAGYEEKLECREIFKDPITDDGTKKSAKGLLRVAEVHTTDSLGKLHLTGYKLFDQQSKEQERASALQTVFIDGQLIVDQSLSQIRKRLSNFL